MGLVTQKPQNKSDFVQTLAIAITKWCTHVVKVFCYTNPKLDGFGNRRWRKIGQETIRIHMWFLAKIRAVKNFFDILTHHTWFHEKISLNTYKN